MREQYKMEINKTHKSAEPKRKKRRQFRIKHFTQTVSSLSVSLTFYYEMPFLQLNKKKYRKLETTPETNKYEAKEKETAMQKNWIFPPVPPTFLCFFYSSRLFFIHSKHSGSVTVTQCRQQEIKISIKIKKKFYAFLLFEPSEKINTIVCSFFFQAAVDKRFLLLVFQNKTIFYKILKESF